MGNIKVILENIMPHRAPLLLIDDIESYNAQQLTAHVTITKNSYGFCNGSVPAWFGVEYMAQAIAAFNGLNYSVPGEKPEVGFLVGVRNYESKAAKFELGSKLKITVALNLILDNTGVFNCHITLENEKKDKIATAVLTTFKPTRELIHQIRQRDQKEL